MSIKEPKEVYFPPSNESIRQAIEHEAQDLVLCIMNDAACYKAYFNRIKQTTRWKKPRPLAKSSWHQLLQFCRGKLPHIKSYFKSKAVRERAIEILKEHYRNDCEIARRDHLEDENEGGE